MAKRRAGQANSSSSTPATGDLRFQVDCGLLLQLGEQAVAKRWVALGELIKNTYDADASRVTVEFRNVSEPGGDIVVSDDGSGMSFEQIRRCWMRIATTDKVEHPESERYGRPRAGSKGIGRFACRRLAQRLVLRSVSAVDATHSKGAKEEVRVEFDWEKYAPGIAVQEVPAYYERRPADPTRDTGVTLELRQAREAWTEEDIASLHRDLLKLISPFPEARRRLTQEQKRDPGFDVEFVAQEFPEQAGAISKRFLKAAWAILKGRIGKEGVPTYTLQFRGKGLETFAPTDTRFHPFGPCRFTIHFFVYRKAYVAGLPINVREARELGREQGGVHIYYDRFRVPSYGDPGDDWLNLDEERSRRVTETPPQLTELAEGARRPMLLLPGNNQLFGAVFLSRFDNPELRQTLNRERLQETGEFEELRKFVRLGINWMTVMHARVVAERTEEARKEARSPRGLLERARHQIEEVGDEINPERRAQVLQAIDLAREAIEEEREEYISELSMLRVLASTGTMIVVFEHELLGVLQGLRESHRNLQEYIGELKSEDRSRFKRVLDRLEGWVKDAEQHGELLGLLVSKSSRERRRRLAVKPLVVRVGESFSRYMQDNGINFDAEGVRPGLRTPPMYECELVAVLINLMTNALKAVRRPELKERRISVEASGDPAGVSIRFSDTGVGARPDKWREYFKPFVTESEPDPILGHGTGLGLKIVADFLDIYGGHAKFVRPVPPWKTCIEVVVPEGSNG